MKFLTGEQAKDRRQESYHNRWTSEGETRTQLQEAHESMQDGDEHIRNHTVSNLRPDGVLARSCDPNLQRNLESSSLPLWIANTALSPDILSSMPMLQHSRFMTTRERVTRASNQVAPYDQDVDGVVAIIDSVIALLEEEEDR